MGNHCVEVYTRRMQAGTKKKVSEHLESLENFDDTRS